MSADQPEDSAEHRVASRQRRWHGPGIELVGTPHIELTRVWPTDIGWSANRYRNVIATAPTLPAQGPPVSDGALYRRDGHLISGSVRRIRERGVRAEPVPSLPPDGDRKPIRLGGDWLYGGYASAHFGHFLLEVLGRLWPVQSRAQAARTNLLFHAWPPSRVESFVALRERRWADRFGFPTVGVPPSFNGPALRVMQAKWLIDALEALGFNRARIRFVPIATARIARITVPTSPLILNDVMHPGAGAIYADLRRRIVPDAVSVGRRVYFSRSLLNRDKRRIDNEPAIERLFEARGFEVVHPQTHGFVEQVKMAASAEMIAGCCGSALHLSLFMKPGGRVFSLDTERNFVNQMLIEEACGHAARHLWCGGANAIRTKDGERRIDLAWVEAELRDFLG